MDWILYHTVPSSVPSVSIGLDYFTDLDYADDVALLVELLDLLEPALLNFSDEASKLGLQVNWKKTVVQSLNDAQGCPSSITVGSETARRDARCVIHINQIQSINQSINHRAASGINS